MKRKSSDQDSLVRELRAALQYGMLLMLGVCALCGMEKATVAPVIDGLPGAELWSAALWAGVCMSASAAVAFALLLTMHPACEVRRKD